MVLIIAVFFVILLVAGVAIFMLVTKKQQQSDATSSEALNRRIAILQEGFEDQGALESRAPEQNPLDSINGDLMNFIGSFTPVPSPEKLDSLNKAGLRTSDAHIALFFQQISGGIVGAGLGFLIIFTGLSFMAGIAIAMCLALLFYMAPASDVRKRIKERSYKIDKTLPDMIDLFANCCVAGVSFDIAAGYILVDLEDDPLIKPIKEDFLAWQADVNFGMERPESWRRLANRSESKNIRYFTSLINQSEKTGGSVAEALFKMSSFFRERRKQQIESEIATLPTKMSSQTIVFIVLPIVLLLLGPVGLNAFRMVAELFGGR
ncbi:MAG: type II secretion system F family protein [Candidatus Caenarcaniphilales bacterium]|nr:type II secretion system F family protein [Candidatus Caenarcaniphilales bacterium]